MKTQTDLKADILAAMAHPNRIRILEALKRGTMCNCELALALGMEQSNLSRHLKILVQAGVLESWKEGLRVNYKVADEKVFTLLETATTIARREARSMAEAVRN